MSNPQPVDESVDEPSFPYVLVTAHANSSTLDVHGGGGAIATPDMVGILLAAVQQLTGVSADAYAQAIEAQRRIEAIQGE